MNMLFCVESYRDLLSWSSINSLPPVAQRRGNGRLQGPGRPSALSRQD
jgi:hypothetical protein